MAIRVAEVHSEQLLEPSVVVPVIASLVVAAVEITV
jgi:hypothetical protein